MSEPEWVERLREAGHTVHHPVPSLGAVHALLNRLIASGLWRYGSLEEYDRAYETVVEWIRDYHPMFSWAMVDAIREAVGFADEERGGPDPMDPALVAADRIAALLPPRAP